MAVLYFKLEVETPDTNIGRINHTEAGAAALPDNSARLLFMTDYDLPEGDPARYSAVLITEEEMINYNQLASEDGQVLYRAPGSIMPTIVPVNEAKALFLANSPMRYTGDTMQKAMIHAVQLGLAATRPMPLQ